MADTLYPQPIRKRYTWWHPSRQSGHTIDHFLVRQSQKRFLDSVRTVHQRGGAEMLGIRCIGSAFVTAAGFGSIRIIGMTTPTISPSSFDFIFGRAGKGRALTGGAVRTQVAPQPYVSLLTAPGEVAKRKRSEWWAALNANMRALGSEDRVLEWQEIVQVCVNTSIQVLGTAPVGRQQPHLRGHQAENRELDQEVANALAYRRSFRGGAEPRSQQRHREYEEACRLARAASQRRKLTRRQWGWEWVDNLTAELVFARFRRAGKLRMIESGKMYQGIARRTRWWTHPARQRYGLAERR